MNEHDARAHDVWAIVPAAGVGKRMASDIPKQYLPLAGSTVLETTLQRLLAVRHVRGVVIAVQASDPYWADIRLNTDKPLLEARGGAERSDSVLNALHALAQYEGFNTDTGRVMVHDAVRPCVRAADIEQLIDKTRDSDAGGLLAAPVRDTMKRQDENQGVRETIEREGLWHAMTPQLFPYRILLQALTEATRQGRVITDESSAMEYAGYRPLLVQGHEDNIKITRPADLRLAELLLAGSGAQEA